MIACHACEVRRARCDLRATARDITTQRTRGLHTAQRVPSRAPHVPLTTRHARRRDDPLEPRIRVRIEKILRELAHGCAAGRPLVRLGLELLLFGLALLHCSAARSSCLLPAALLRRRLHVGGAGRRR